jgi:hypothetical protein
VGHPKNEGHRGDLLVTNRGAFEGFLLAENELLLRIEFCRFKNLSLLQGLFHSFKLCVEVWALEAGRNFFLQAALSETVQVYLLLQVFCLRPRDF